VSNEEMLKQILIKGDYQESTKERKEKVEQKRKEIVNFIHKYYVDPKTKVPHPVSIMLKSG
jgi:ribosome maturation protein SDO1